VLQERCFRSFSGFAEPATDLAALPPRFGFQRFFTLSALAHES
jgi:hypothetical protein